jgi:hypothetical protein
VTRCPKCYRREDAFHRLLGHCPELVAKPKRSRVGYVPPCRAGRQSWADYLAGRASTPEEKRELARLRQQRHRARKAAA